MFWDGLVDGITYDSSQITIHHDDKYRLIMLFTTTIITTRKVYTVQ